MVRPFVDKYKMLIGILLLYLVLGGAYSLVVPMFEAPDEVWHYGYVHWIASGRGLSHPDDAGGAGVQQYAQEGSQPPLYYLLAALLTAPITGPASGAQAPDEWAVSVRYNPHAAIGDAEALGNRNHLLHGGWDDWPWQGIALGGHLARFFSTLLGAITVVFAYLCGRLLVGSPASGFQQAGGWHTLIPLLAAALVAFTPQFLFITASVSNDNIATAVCAAGVWLGAALACGRIELRRRSLLVLGLLVGLAALSKLSGLLLGPFALLCVALGAWRRRSWRSLLVGGALVTGVALAVAGWWYWRNWQLYGDPLGLAAMFAVGPARDEPAGLAELLALAPGVWRSAWAVFGWFNITAPEWVYWFYTGLAILALAGWAPLALRRLLRQNRERQVSWLAAALLAAWALAITAALVRWAQINFPQGRLLFPAIAAAMPLLAAGLLAWWPRAWRRWVALILGGSMATLAAVLPFAVIVPAYTPPPLLDVPPSAGKFWAEINLGEHIELVGWDLPDSLTQAAPGDVFDITLYWRADALLTTDYSVFAHLVDELGIVQAQNDSHPARGLRPTSRWLPGEVIADPHRLVIPTGLAPGRITLEVGMYDYASGERLPLTFVSRENGERFELEGFADSLALSSFETPVERDAEGIPNPTHIDFGGQIALTGYELKQYTLKPQDTLPVSFWWEALAPMERDYVAFVHLVLPPDAVWAQLDRMPHPAPDNQLRPTSTWQVGEVIQDTFMVDIPAAAPPGIYDVAIGWYDKDSFERLPVAFDDSDLVIARVRVETP